MDSKPTSRKKNLGLPPGTPVFIGEQMVDQVEITYFQYNETDVKEEKIVNLDNDFPIFEDKSVTWINIIGIHDIKLIKKIGEKISLDLLLQEDIVNTESRSKIEDMNDYFFLVLKDLEFNTKTLEIHIEHFTFIVSGNYILTFQEDVGDQFDTIRERIRKNKGLIRTSGVDYLFNRLLDTIVDNYYHVVEQLGTHIDNLEDRVIRNPSQETLQNIQNLKSELIYLRRTILPVREVVGIISKLDEIVISTTTIVYVRSIFDHLNQIIDQIEIYREMLTGFLEIYLSSISNKTNDVMKLLTIITSVFIPLSFLSGVFGMNFDNMPELHYKWSYPILWVIYFIIAGSMLYYFKKLGWLNSD